MTMKNLLLLFVLFLVGCTTTRYVYVDPKDGSKISEFRNRMYYDDLYYSSPRFDPFFWDRSLYWYSPYYRPGIGVIVPPRRVEIPKPQQPRYNPLPSRPELPKPSPGPKQAPIRRFEDHKK